SRRSASWLPGWSCRSPSTAAKHKTAAQNARSLRTGVFSVDSRTAAPFGGVAGGLPGLPGAAGQGSQGFPGGGQRLAVAQAPHPGEGPQQAAGAEAVQIHLPQPCAQGRCVGGQFFTQG